MVYITGDTHGDVPYFCKEILKKLNTTNDKDTLIICGDFGFIFLNDLFESSFLDYLEKLKITICFVDGNHENFPVIYSYPVEEWNGGKTHRIRKNIYHLMRGQVFTIEGKTFFTFGGAYSIDRAYRKLGESYWNEEMPSNEEYHTAIDSLKLYGNKVDFILTHTAPNMKIVELGFYPDAHDAELTGFFSWISESVEFKNWFFGHFHTDKIIDEKFTAVFHKLHTLE